MKKIQKNEKMKKRSPSLLSTIAGVTVNRRIQHRITFPTFSPFDSYIPFCFVLFATLPLVNFFNLLMMLGLKHPSLAPPRHLFCCPRNQQPAISKAQAGVWRLAGQLARWSDSNSRDGAQPGGNLALQHTRGDRSLL